jgi:hypothetical protein
MCNEDILAKYHSRIMLNPDMQVSSYAGYANGQGNQAEQFHQWFVLLQIHFLPNDKTNYDSDSSYNSKLHHIGLRFSSWVLEKRINVEEIEA